jgi:hypothetical protein
MATPARVIRSFHDTPNIKVNVAVQRHYTAHENNIVARHLGHVAISLPVTTSSLSFSALSVGVPVPFGSMGAH